MYTEWSGRCELGGAMSVDHCQREIHLLAGEVAQIQSIAQTWLHQTKQRDDNNFTLLYSFYNFQYNNYVYW